MKRFRPLAFFFILMPLPVLAQPKLDNSNFWPVHRNTQAMFRISYPADWVVAPPKGRNVRFSVNPPDGSGNCNVVVRTNAETKGFTQEELNREIESLPQTQAAWAEYVGLPRTQVRVLESRVAKIGNIPALLGVIETQLENLEGKYTRYQFVATTFKPGQCWSLNCGTSSFQKDAARERFNTFRSTFEKVLGSFMFLN